MKRTTILSLVFLVAIVACKRAETPVATQTAKPEPRGQQPQPGTDVGAMMPEYTAMTLDGAKFDLASHRDKVVLLNLWATWCFPCRAEMPALQKIHNDYGPKGFEVIGVSVDEGGTEGVKQFIAEEKLTFPIVMDPEGKLANLFQTSVIPTTALIDRKGKVLWKHYGQLDANDATLKQAIEKAL